MPRSYCLPIVIILFLAFAVLPIIAVSETLEKTSITKEKIVKSSEKEKSKERYVLKDPIKALGNNGYCIDCHRDETPAIFEEWTNSTHARAGVGCNNCHEGNKSNEDSIFHANRFYISSVVTPFNCAKCHKDQLRDYVNSGHGRSLELLKQMKEDDPRYPVVAQFKEDNFSQCSGCHGTEVTIDKQHLPDPATWPNSGAGRINHDKSHGSCAVCHMGHRFSVAAARQPETCLRCHDGANYPEGDIYTHSAHATAYETLTDKEVLERPGFYLDGVRMVSPTCSFCHMNGSGQGLLTRHNTAWRLPRDLTSPMAPLVSRAENLRNNMKSVCNQCHATRVIDSFFEDADARLQEYQKNEVEPQLAAYRQKLAQVEGEEKKQLLKEYSRFLAEGKRFRMNLYMGHHGRTQR